MRTACKQDDIRLSLFAWKRINKSSIRKFRSKLTSNNLRGQREAAECKYLSKMGLSVVSRDVTPPVAPRAKKKNIPAKSLGCKSLALAFSSYKYSTSYISNFTQCFENPIELDFSTNPPNLTILPNNYSVWYN